MDALLRWSIENSTRSEDAPAGAEPTVPHQPIDPAIIDLILGKPDSEVMKENLAVAADESKSVDERVSALDNFEMLIEQIDNANNLAPLKMWESLITLSKSPHDPIRLHALWILGTATQNNPQAQEIYLSYKPLSGVLEILSSPDSDASPETRSKAVYCISNAVRHSAQAVHQLGSLGGWKVLNGALTDSSVPVRRKTAFLLNTLLLQDGPSPEEADPVKLPSSVHANLPSHFPSSTQTTTNGTSRAAFQSSGILTTLLHSLVSPVPHGPDGDGAPDADFEEKSIHVILTFVQFESSLSSPTLKGQHGLNDEQRGLLAQVLKSTGKESGLERWNLVEEEWATLEASL